MRRILVLGAGGQIGSELVPYLRGLYGRESVIASDVRENAALAGGGPFIKLDALDRDGLGIVVTREHVDTIFNLVALLSATGEQNPPLAWKVNMGALTNALEVARETHAAVFTPSSIGAFGDSTPKDGTPQDTIMRPETIYGVCKVAGELLSDYYHKRFGVDSRSLRLPGIISNVTLPGGGTTDYAVDVFYAAVRGEEFVCPIPEGIYMDMMYMPDALRAIVELMEADPEKLVHRNSFNIASMSFEPEELFKAIRQVEPSLEVRYEVDPVREAIARSWPNWLDDSAARSEWGWKPQWNLMTMVGDMLRVLNERKRRGELPEVAAR